MRFGRLSAAKIKNLSAERRDAGLGSVWTWTAVDANTKLIPSWLVSTRDAGAAYEFMQDVAGRLRHRVQLTTDGHERYLSAVEDVFGADIDYATLTKIYGVDPDGEKRYSPPVCLGCEVKTVQVRPTRSTSLRATLNGRTSRCGCRCVGLRA